ncbi:MAG TPA: FHA domain-containing protein, partial [Anaerolineae bacterium]|nr:FHA domain-containing protein [Anaerolineae bacterium]
MFKLTVRSGAQAGMEFPVDRPVVVIGRGSGSDIILQDSQASRKHAEISQQGDQYYIRDLGSTNGTYVNGQRITGSHPLRPGDSIQIGDTVLVSAPMGAVATAAPADDWESSLYASQVGAPAGGGKRWLVVGAIGAVVILLLAAVAAAAWMLIGGGKSTPTPIVMLATNTPTAGAIAVQPTTTQPARPQPTAAAPTNTPLVQVETPAVPAPTVTMAVPPPTGAVQPPPTGAAPPPITPPAQMPTGMPTGMPTSPEDLEQLPKVVREYLGDIPPDQLPQVISEQIQNMSQEELQQMIGALFPGVPLEQLPEVVAASFPGLSAEEVEGLMAIAFPGQNFKIPKTELGAPIGGKMALGIFDKSRGAYDLYLADQAMAQPRLLAQNATDPGFSPDGQYIVYHSSAPDKAGLRIMKVDGSEDRALTTIASD